MQCLVLSFLSPQLAARSNTSGASGDSSSSSRAKEGVVLYYNKGDAKATVLFGVAGVARAVKVRIERLIPVEEVAPTYKQRLVSRSLLTTITNITKVRVWSPSLGGSSAFVHCSEPLLWAHQIRSLASVTLLRLLEESEAADGRAAYMYVAEQRGFFKVLFQAALEPIAFQGFPDKSYLAYMSQALMERRLEYSGSDGVRFDTAAASAAAGSSTSVLHGSGGFSEAERASFDKLVEFKVSLQRAHRVLPSRNRLSVCVQRFWSDAYSLWTCKQALALVRLKLL
jgi:hypothetical protein